MLGPVENPVMSSSSLEPQRRTLNDQNLLQRCHDMTNWQRLNQCRCWQLDTDSNPSRNAEPEHDSELTIDTVKNVHVQSMKLRNEPVRQATIKLLRICPQQLDFFSCSTPPSGITISCHILSKAFSGFCVHIFAIYRTKYKHFMQL